MYHLLQLPYLLFQDGDLILIADVSLRRIVLLTLYVV